MFNRTLQSRIQICVCSLVVILAAVAVAPISGSTLFPTDLPQHEFTSFAAQGFSQPVCGVIFSGADPTCCGVSLGGLGTGCLDVMAEGVFGFNTLYPAPRRRPMAHYRPYQSYYRNPQQLLPFLGLSTGGQTWVLSKQKFLDGGKLHGCVEVGMGRDLLDKPEWLDAWETEVPPTSGVKPAEEITYWGHYPVADLQYQTDAPIQVALRAWSPFVPGAMDTSNTPGAVFEVHLTNPSAKKQSGTLAFAFPGPVQTAVEYNAFQREQTNKPYPCLTVASNNGDVGYTLAALGADRVRFGGSLTRDPGAWSQIATTLPAPQITTVDGQAYDADPGTSVAADFTLAGMETKTIRFFLGWFSRGWQSGPWTDLCYSFEREGFEPGDWTIPGRTSDNGIAYTSRYTSQFADSKQVVDQLVAEHENILTRILAWQQVIYTDQSLPVWLRDCLVNNLNIITKTSYWAAPGKYEWSLPHGQFGMDESPRGCSIMGCIVSNWYGDWPVMYLFPELEKTILRCYKYYQRPDGATAFLFPSGDFNAPTYEWLLPLNGVCYVDLVARLWLRTGDQEILQEFYPSVKQATNFSVTLKPGPEGVISMHREGTGQEWWEHTPVFGMVTHAAGMRLSTLALAKRMAMEMGDLDYARQCQTWLDQGTQAMEENLWAGDSYLFFNDPLGTGKKNDDILSSQLDGDFANYIHGLPGVFNDQRAKTTLQTIKDTCFVDYGLVGFATRKDGPQYEGYGSFCAEIAIVGMTYMYHGQKDFGGEIIKRHMNNVVCRQGHGWDLPNMIRCDNGKRYFGTDYFQNMIIWAIPAAIAGSDLAGPCRPNGLVNRIFQACSGEPTR